MKQTLKQISLLTQGANVIRFHTVPTIQQESVGHHSMLVAGLALILWPDRPQLLPHAIIHDLPELITGDMPSPGKRAYGDRDALKKVEGEILDTAGVSNLLPALSATDEACLKACDILAGIATCSREYNMGNRWVLPSLHNYVSYLGELISKGVVPDAEKIHELGHRLATAVAGVTE